MSTQETEFESSCSCAICMEELGTSIESCPCGHVYHKRCIRAWILQKRVCPQCKGDALPLIQLQFNQFHLSRDELKLSTEQQLGVIKNDISAVSLDIETELAEINVLEPQLAEGRAEEAAYTQGVRAREKRRKDLEAELEPTRFKQFELESRRKQLNEELEAIREKLSMLHLDFNTETPSSRRPISAKDVSKLVVFMQADVKKLKEIESESDSLNALLADGRQKLTNINSRIRDLAEGGTSLPELVKHTHKQISGRVDGFVPIDSMGHKRRRDEDRLREIENRKPNLLDGSYPTQKQSRTISSLDSLSVLVGFLSDTDDVADTPMIEPTQRVRETSISRGPKESMTLDALFSNSNVIVLD